MEVWPKYHFNIYSHHPNPGQAQIVSFDYNGFLDSSIALFSPVHKKKILRKFLPQFFFFFHSQILTLTDINFNVLKNKIKSPKKFFFFFPKLFSPSVDFAPNFGYLLLSAGNMKLQKKSALVGQFVVPNPDPLINNITIPENIPNLNVENFILFPYEIFFFYVRNFFFFFFFADDVIITEFLMRWLSLTRTPTLTKIDRHLWRFSERKMVGKF